MPQPEQIPFQTEIRQILDLVIHSLYTHKEIFLRELISNASDAIDKRRYEGLTNHALALTEGQYKIHLSPDKEKRTLSISDNGIGMNHDELIANIGTIARSGSREFLKAIQGGAGAPGAPELIGQFGVGFYSSFMVAETVTILTRKAGEEKAWRWESTGEGSFTIEETTKAEPGTTIVLALKSPESGDQDFTEEWVLREVVRKYSDFVTYPVTMMIHRDEPAKDTEGKLIEGGGTVKIVKEETLNSMKALWTRKPSEISEEEYTEFYKHLAHDWEPPLKTIHFSAEGLLEYQALLYIPSRAPLDLFFHERRQGVHLYAKRIFIMDECRELMPEYLRFVKGLVDCADLPLNVSRETIQNNRQIAQIRKRLVSKTLDALAELKEKDSEKYLTFWNAFGRVLKEGLMHDAENRDRIRDLILFQTTADPSKLSSFQDYRERMKPDQKEIWYLTGESRAAIENSPHIEQLKSRGIEVILFTEAIDEIAMPNVEEFDDKEIKSAAKGEIESVETKTTEYASLVEFLSGKLKDQVKEVRLSPRLKSSAVCLVTEEHGLAAHVEKLLRQSNQPVPEQKRVLEINPEHPLTSKMQKMFEENRSDPTLDEYAQLLYGQAALTEGVPLPDPVKYANLIANLMTK